jgi:hypothetical protein
MSARLRRYLLEAYSCKREVLPAKLNKDFPIQIDDQDDNDSLSDLCVIFVTVDKHNGFTLELSGKIIISKEISDLAEIYNGFVEQASGRVVLNLKLQQIDAITDLAKSIRKSALADENILMTSQHRISARTISSLYRFVRIIKEYIRSKNSTF